MFNLRHSTGAKLLWWILLPFALIDTITLRAAPPDNWFSSPALTCFYLLNMIGGLLIWLGLARLAFSPCAIGLTKFIWGLHVFGNIAFSLVCGFAAFSSLDKGDSPQLAYLCPLGITFARFALVRRLLHQNLQPLHT